MAESKPLTVGDVAEIFGVDAWRIRRIVDSLPAEIPRAGTYRLISRVHLPAIGAELHRRGWTATPDGQDGERA